MLEKQASAWVMGASGAMAVFSKGDISEFSPAYGSRFQSVREGTFSLACGSRFQSAREGTIMDRRSSSSSHEEKEPMIGYGKGRRDTRRCKNQ